MFVMPPIEKINTKEVGAYIGGERRKKARVEKGDMESLEKDLEAFSKKLLYYGPLVEEIDLNFRMGKEKISMNEVKQNLEEKGFSTEIEMPDELLETEVLECLAGIGVTNIGITQDLDGYDVGLIAIPMKLSGENVPANFVLKALSSSLKDSEECETINSKYLELLSKSEKFGHSLEEAIEIVMEGLSPDKVHQEKTSFFIYEEESINRNEMNVYIVGITTFDLLQNSGLGEDSIIKQYLDHPDRNEG